MHPDDALSDPKKDELDRSGFAKALAHSILTMDVNSPFVFSIEGEWGSGKSTILAFTKYYLTHRNEINSQVPLEVDPIIVEFSPWWFSGSDDLLRQFIREISLQLRANKKVLEKLKSLPSLLDNLGAALSSSFLPAPEPTQMALLASALRKVLSWLLRDRDVASLRHEIEKVLKRQPNRIVVFLDDLDRLHPEELLQVFQCVKAIASLPRLIYVLGFDQEAVQKMLTKVGIHNPHQYLEKIMQSVWSLPAPDQLGIARMTEKAIEELVDTSPKVWQQDRWQSLYRDGLEHLIRTPRDVKRMANALRAAYPPVRSEVNPVDFVGFHTLRVLVPAAYSFIRSNRSWLTRANFRFLFRDENDELKDRINVINQFLSSLRDGDRGPVAKMIETMFPMFNTQNKKSRFDGLEVVWRQEARICSVDRFDFYERLAIPVGAISSAELGRILRSPFPQGLLEDLQHLATATSHDGDVKLRKFLEYSRGSISTYLSKEERQRLLINVFQVSDQLISKTESYYVPFFSTDWEFAWLVTAIIDLLPKGTERVSALVEAWRGGDSVSLMTRCYYLWFENLEKYEAGSYVSNVPFNREEIEHVKDVLLQRVKFFAKSGLLVKTPFLGFVLHFWDEQDDGGGSRYAADVSQSDEGFCWLAVGAMRDRPPSSTSTQYRSDVAALTRWTGMGGQELSERCARLLDEKAEWLQEIHRIALQACIDEVQNPRDAWGRPKKASADNLKPLPDE
ncbi:MAG: P-loop NTPase fold protein [Bryobacterales bacterium]